jgi:hypothetical protein
MGDARASCASPLGTPLAEVVTLVTVLELLQRIVPTPEEIKAYREYVFQKKDLEKLTEEDR